MKFGEPCCDTSSIESEGMLDDDQSDVDSISTSSMLSLHPSENTINELYPFPLVGFDLFEENMLEENFSFPNNQSLNSPFSLGIVDESFPSQELLLTEPKWNNYKCDSTQMTIIDPYDVYLEKTFGENHQVNNNPFGVLCEGSGQYLELDFNLKSRESLPFSSVGVDLFEENMLVANFSSLNDQSLETVDESFLSQELLLAEYIWDNHKYDSNQMAIIDPYEV